MKTSHLLNLLLGTTVILLAGCGKSPEAQPVVDNTPARVIEITANDQMKFSVTTMDAKPGEKISVVLRNVGTMPKISMGHNWVLLNGKIPAETFIEASQTKAANDYVAPQFKSNVLAATKLLGPGESDTITFSAPKAPGAYPFLCSFPGHYGIGMKGFLTVK